jgi:Ca2+-binding RTX toxin-like protein
MFRSRKSGAASSPRSASVRLGVEQLGARDVPAILFNPATGFLDVEGTSFNDTATLEWNADFFGTPTIDVTLVSTDAAGREVSREFQWFYANDVLRIEFHGAAGDDTLNASQVRLTAFGDDGNDRLFAIGNLFGGAGRDYLVATPTSGRNVLDGGTENDVLVGSNNRDTLRGGAGNDILRGMGGNDIIWGGLGDDRMEGGLGDDWMYGEGGNDTMLGGLGNDWLEGGTGNDLMIGDDWFPQAADGNDFLLGGTGADTMYGHGGADWLDPGVDPDVDVVYGGPGPDTFVVNLVRPRSAPPRLIGYENDVRHGDWSEDHMVWGGVYQL